MIEKDITAEAARQSAERRQTQADAIERLVDDAHRRSQLSPSGGSETSAWSPAIEQSSAEAERRKEVRRRNSVLLSGMKGAHAAPPKLAAAQALAAPVRYAAARRPSPVHGTHSTGLTAPVRPRPSTRPPQARWRRRRTLSTSSLASSTACRPRPTDA